MHTTTLFSFFVIDFLLFYFLSILFLFILLDAFKTTYINSTQNSKKNHILLYALIILDIRSQSFCMR
jgi:hypothetical protein